MNRSRDIISLKAIDAAHRILRVNGRVIPVSNIASNLVATLEDGRELEGEHLIDERETMRSRISLCRLQPTVTANPEAIAAIREADVVVIGPGDLFSSIVPVLLPDGIANALMHTKAPILYVVNLVTKPGQTDEFTAEDHIRTVAAYSGGRMPDVVIMNSADTAAAIRERYASQGERLVRWNNDGSIPSRVILAPLIANGIHEHTAGDRITRSLIRHDPDKLAHAILMAF